MADTIQPAVNASPIDIEEKVDQTYVESSPIDPEAANTLKWSTVKAEADRDEEYQHSLTLWQSLRTYKAACFWSVIASFCIVMEG